MTAQELYERSFTKTASLSRIQVPDVIAPLEVIRVLNRAKVRFVLVGAYGIAGWMKEPRATEDVDVVVYARHIKKATTALLEAFPHLEAVDLPVVRRLREKGGEAVAIDLMKPVQQPYREIFKYAQEVSATRIKYLIPTLEMALTMKFAAMTSIYRAVKDKYQDAHDFIVMVQANPEPDRDSLLELGTLMYPDGGKDLIDTVAKARAGEDIIL